MAKHAGQPANWKVQDGYMEVTPPNGNDIRTTGNLVGFPIAC